MTQSQPKSKCSHVIECLLGGLAIFACVLGIVGLLILLFAFTQRLPSKQSGLMQKSRTIVLCLFDYAQDHGGNYPDGKTSTEVFQKLIDGGYVSYPHLEDETSDQNLFYFPMPGKVKPSSRKLKPENVCWDVTSGLNVLSPPETPVVYMTGYKIDYAPGSRAVPEKWPAPTWWNWLTASDFPRGYIVVSYMSNNTFFLRAASDNSIPNFVPPHLVLSSKNYHQLTPDGQEPQ